MSSPEKSWMYLHSRCHIDAGTYLRIGPDGLHVLECAACDRIITAFRVIEAENAMHDPRIHIEEEHSNDDLDTD